MKKVTITAKVAWWVAPFTWICSQIAAAAFVARMIDQRQWDALCDKGVDVVVRHGIKFKVD